MGRSFSSSYLAGEPAAQPFFDPAFRSRDARIARARLAADRILAPSLLSVLREQQARLPASPARAANLDALGAGRTAVVVTGQQIGLFLGPLYAFYKAASAIAVARAIEAESGVRCVPLFWLQTEDHDFAEIQSCMVADAEGTPLRLTLDDKGGDPRASVAARILPAQVDALVAALGEALGGTPTATETLTLVREHYRAGRPMADAFAGLLGALFADEGLLIFNPRDARVAALAAPVYRACLDDAPAIERALNDRGDALLSAGFDEQVAIRDHGALIFFHRGDAAGPRFRLLRRGDGDGLAWSLAGGAQTLPHAELVRLLDADPLRFSTSALLRPVVQDTLWPTVAYVGGPGEINYFAQVAPLYARFGLQPPLLVPRARFRCADARVRRWLGQAGLRAADLALPADTLRARLPTSVPKGMPSPAELRAVVEAQLVPVLDGITQAVSAAGDTLRRPIQRTRGTVAHALDRLINRYENTLFERDQVGLRRIQRLARALMPDGIPQERYYAWPWLAGRVGPLELKRLVLDKLHMDAAFVTEVWDLVP